VVPSSLLSHALTAGKALLLVVLLQMFEECLVCLVSVIDI